MRRRALLASLATLSAGCLGSGSSESSTTTTTAQTETPPATAKTETLGPNAEFAITDLDVSTRTDGPEFRYVLEPSAVYSEDAVERKETRTGEDQTVMAVSEIGNPAVREAVETAIEDGEWRSNDLPAGLADLVERVDFFTNGRTGLGTHVGLTLHRLDPDAPPAIEFDASVVDPAVAPDDPGVVELGLTNVGPTPRKVFSGTVPPFGMVFAESTDGDDRLLLWRPYEEEGCIQFPDDGGWFRCDIGQVTELAPG